MSSLAPVVAIASLLALMLWRSLACGRHQLFFFGNVRNFGVEAIALALSRIYYGAGGDYLGLKVIEEEMRRLGLPKLPGFNNPVIYDGAALDRILRRCGEIEWSRILDSRKTIFLLDKGYVDFVTWAFRLFGVRIAALHHLYYLVLAAECAAYVAAFHDRPGYLWALSGLLGCFYLLIFESALFSRVNLISTVTDIHFASSLVVVPALHLILTILGGEVPAPALLAVTAVQAGFLLLAVSMRGTAQWALLLAVPLAAVLRLLADLFRHGLGADSLAHGYWALFLLGALAIASTWRTNAAASRIYASDEGCLSHSAWHTAYSSLPADTEHFPKACLPGQRTSTDRVHGFDDANGYVAAHHVLLTQQPDLPLDRIYPRIDKDYNGMYGDIKWGLYNRLVQRAALDYLAADWRRTALLYLYYKPLLYLSVCRDVVAPLFHLGDWKARLAYLPNVLVLLVIALSAAAFGVVGDGADGLLVLAAALVMLLTSPAPNIWAHSRHEIVGEQCWLLLFGLWTVAMLVATVLGRIG